VTAEFYGDSTQDQQPKHDHQGEIEAAECGCEETREREKQRPTNCQQPNFVSIPHGADGMQDLALLGLGPSHKELDDSGTKIEAIEHDVNRDHYRDQTEPERCHDENPLYASACFAVQAV
jgi:hypothetical protein